jgi:DDE domain
MGLAVKVPVVGSGRIVMPFKFHRNGRHHIPRQKFRVTNWRDYEAALRSRGSLTIWFTAKAVADWRAQPRATPGGQRHYSDLAIETPTYVKIKGRWTYLYPAVDTEGKTVDFLLRAKRDAAAAKAFFRLAFRRQGRLPLKITLDGYQASHRAAKEALDEHPEGNQCKIRSTKYLNNLIEQDHRSVKLRLGPMLGLKHFRQAGNDDRRHRTYASDPEGSVQTR